MEPAKIDWKAIDSIFIRDELYENISAPQWIDFLSLDDDTKAIDDEAWFCRPDCKHPKTAEDFLKSTPTSASKLLRSVAVSKLINGFGDWNRRDANLKRRGQAQSTLLFPDEQDSENQDPNYLQTPPRQHNHSKSLKEAIKSSAEKKNNITTDKEEANDEQQPIRQQLKSTLSGRDLFGGKDIFGKITDFCNELKKRIATTKVMKEEEEEEEQGGKDSLLEMKESCLLVEEEEEIDRQVVVVNGSVTTSSAKEKKRKPFGEVSKDRLMRPAVAAAAAGENGSNSKNSINRPRRKKRVDDDDGENNHLVSIDLNNIRGKSKESERQQQQIRTLPPTPQCFSAIKKGSSATTPSKGPKSRIMDMDTMLLQQVDKDDDNQNNKVVFNGEEKTKNVKANTAAVTATSTITTTEAGSKEGSAARMTTLDVFWFLKPCALSSS